MDSKKPSGNPSTISKAPAPVITPIPYTPGMSSGLARVMDNAVRHRPKFTLRDGNLSVDLPAKPRASFQTHVNSELRTQAEVNANLRSPFEPPSSTRVERVKNEETLVGPDEDVELNAIHRFRLEPDDNQPLEFVGALIAQAVVERGATQRTWIGLYRTRGGKIISEIVRDDGRARNVGWELGDRFRTVKIFDTLDIALASIRSAALRNQLMGTLGLLTTRFVE